MTRPSRPHQLETGEPSPFSSHPWEEALTRRLRALVRTTPLHRVEQGKAQRGELFSSQDLRALALRTLDLVIERMGLGTGATIPELRVELCPLVHASAPGLARDGAEEIAESIVFTSYIEPLLGSRRVDTIGVRDVDRLAAQMEAR